jgi:hypothetical protein
METMKEGREGLCIPGALRATGAMIINTRPDAQTRSIRRHEDCMRRRLVFQQGLTSFVISKLDLWALLSF